MTVWITCSFTPSKKEISAFAVLIVQMLLEESADEVDVKELSLAG
jgi:hypothetical protein